MDHIVEPPPSPPSNFIMPSPLSSLSPKHDSKPRTQREFPEAPVFYPTPKEFEDPLAYIAKIRHIGEQTGILKIVPPDWKPDFALDTQKFRFIARKQPLSSLDGASRVAQNYCEALLQFHEQHVKPLHKVPSLQGTPVDLYKLKRLVEDAGGPEKVQKDRKWSDIGRKLGLIYSTTSSTLRHIHVTVIAPYEHFLKNVARAVSLNSVRTTKQVSGFTTITRSRVAAESKKRARQESDPSVLLSSTSTSLSASTPTSKLSQSSLCSVCSSISPKRGGSQLIKCDDCEKSFHLTCTLVKKIPKCDWICHACLKRSGDDFGFEDNVTQYSLAEFQAKSDDLKSKHFVYKPNTRRGRSDRDGDGAGQVTEEEVEKEFWRLVESPYEVLEVEYGADLHTSDHGSGFPTKRTHPTSPFSTSSWNLNNLPVLSDSLLSHIKGNISGMTIPWLYVGMLFSTFCWHKEDHHAYSINYLHWGDTKSWYGVPSSDADLFEAVMRKEVPELFILNPDLLFHITTMISPSKLVKEGVKVYSCDQRAGEFVVTFPRAYHGGYNHGFNIAEAVNFALPDWLPFGRECVDLYKTYRKPPVFSHDELILTMASAGISNPWLLAELVNMQTREIAGRQAMRKLNIPEGIGKRSLLPPPEAQKSALMCGYCNCFVHVTSISCGTCSGISCFNHIAKMCKCSGKNLRMEVHLSDEELLALTL